MGIRGCCFLGRGREERYFTTGDAGGAEEGSIFDWREMDHRGAQRGK